MAIFGLSLNTRRVSPIIALLPASLLLSWLASMLLTVDGSYGTVEAQTASHSADFSLPNGPGKELVLRACVKCHNMKVITNKRASEEEWARSVDNMVNRGAVLSDDEVDEVIEYLSQNFKPADSDQKSQPDNTQQQPDKTQQK